MAQLFKNNAKSRLATTFGLGDSSFTITSGDGNLFPITTPSDENHFLVTLERANGVKEIVEISSRSGDTFTVSARAVEAVDGNAPTEKAFEINDLVELRLTAGFIDSIKKGSIVFVIDGGGSVITAGMKGFIEIPFGGSIDACRLFADAIGSIALDIYKTDFSGYDPDVLAGDSIVASAPPTISGAYASEDVSLTGWTRMFEAGDILYFEVTGTPSVITKCTVSLTVNRN